MLSSNFNYNFFRTFLFVFFCLLCAEDNACGAESVLSSSQKVGLRSYGNDTVQNSIVFVNPERTGVSSSSGGESRELKKKTSSPVASPSFPTFTPPSQPSQPSPSNLLYITIELSPIHLTLTSTSDQFELGGREVLKILRVTKNHFKKYFSSSHDFSLKEVSFQIENKQNIDGNRRRRLLLRADEESWREEEKRSINPKWQQNTQRHLAGRKGVAIEITGNATFENDSAPKQDKIKERQKEIFSNSYTDSIKTEVFGNAVTVEVSFGIDDKTNVEQGNETVSTNDHSTTEEISSGNGGSKTGETVAGAMSALAVVGVATAVFIKFQRNKQSKKHGHLELSTLGNRNNDINNDSYYDENHRYSVVYEMKNMGDYNKFEEGNKISQNNWENNPSRLEHNSSQSKGISPGNVIISNNDDGSVIEAVYASPVKLSSNFSRYFSASPRRAKDPSRSPSNQTNIATAVVPDDTYSLDGSYAIDNEKPTNGDNMLGHILSMNSYNGGLASPDATSAPNEDDPIEDDSALVGDLSVYSYSNEYSADCQSVISAKTSASAFSVAAGQKGGSKYSLFKKKTIHDLGTVAACNSQASPERDDRIIFEVSPSNPGINVVSSHRPHEIVANQSKSIACSPSPEINLLDETFSNDGSSSGILLDEEEGGEEEEEEIPSTANRLQQSLHNAVSTSKREEHQDSHRVSYDCCNIVPTETINMNNPEICRTSSTIAERRHQHKITVTTSAPPPPPRTPEKFPLQSAKVPINVNNRNEIKRVPFFHSDSESSDDEMSYFDFSPEERSTQEQKVSTEGQKDDGFHKEPKENYHSSHIDSNPFVEIHDSETKYRRNFTNQSANARNARRNRLGKSIERKTSKDNTSQAEIVSGLRRTRVQRQQMMGLPRESRRLRKDRLQRKV